MKAYNEATSRSYYLNNSGSRSIRIDADGNHETILVNDGTSTKARAKARSLKGASVAEKTGPFSGLTKRELVMSGTCETDWI